MMQAWQLHVALAWLGTAHWWFSFKSWCPAWLQSAGGGGAAARPDRHAHHSAAAAGHRGALLRVRGLLRCPLGWLWWARDAAVLQTRELPMPPPRTCQRAVPSPLPPCHDHDMLARNWHAGPARGACSRASASCWLCPPLSACRATRCLPTRSLLQPRPRWRGSPAPAAFEPTEQTTASECLCFATQQTTGT